METNDKKSQSCPVKSNNVMPCHISSLSLFCSLKIKCPCEPEARNADSVETTLKRWTPGRPRAAGDWATREIPGDWTILLGVDALLLLGAFEGGLLSADPMYCNDEKKCEGQLTQSW